MMWKTLDNKAAVNKFNPVLGDNIFKIKNFHLLCCHLVELILLQLVHHILIDMIQI